MPDQNIRDIETSELVDELKRRKAYFDGVTVNELRDAALDLGTHLRPHRDRMADRAIALCITGVLTAVILIALVVIALKGDPIPDVLSGLGGTGLGAIAGMLTGPTLGDGKTTRRSTSDVV